MRGEETRGDEKTGKWASEKPNQNNRKKKHVPFRGLGTLGAGVQRQIKSLLPSKTLGLAVLGVLRFKLSIFGRFASSVLMEAARFLVIGPGGPDEEAEAEAEEEEEEGGGRREGGNLADDDAPASDADDGEVSDPCCLTPADAAAPDAAVGPAGLVAAAAMAERVKGPPVGAE